jgi:hypothetical protein
MGLGVGVDCEACGRQLDYDRDCAEIVHYTEIDEQGQQQILHRPVLCSNCVRAARALARLTTRDLPPEPSCPTA